MTKFPQPDNRLLSIANHVGEGITLADIGTDHAYLLAYLMTMGKIKSAYACDINELPLKNAHETLEKYNLTDKVHCVLTDGLNGLDISCIDEFVIAGMGGKTIISILDSCKKDLYNKKFILQPMTKFEHLREYLITHGFEIIQEDPVVSGKFVYTLIVCRKTGENQNKSLDYKYLGEIMNSSLPEKERYLKRVYINISRRLDGLMKATGHEKEKETYRNVIEKIEKHWGVTK